MDFMKERYVHIPDDLTTDPCDKRGEIGVIEKTDVDRRTATVLFGDGVKGEYQFEALETLFPYKALLYRFQMHYANMKYKEIETVKNIVTTSSRSGTLWALQMACFDEVIKGICVTDCDTYYEMHQDISKSVGIPKGVRRAKAEVKLLGRVVRIFQNDRYRTGEFGLVNEVYVEERKARLLLKNGDLHTYEFNSLQTLNPLKVLMTKFEKRYPELSNTEIESIQRVINYLARKKHLWALEIALSQPNLRSICVTDLNNFYNLKKANTMNLAFPKKS